MNIRATIGALGLAAATVFAGPVAAACTDSFSLGSIGPPGVTSIGNAFDQPAHFDDCYNFTLSNSADAFGLTLQWDWSLASNIDVTSVSLSGGSLPATVIDNTPDWFSFSNLLGGAYQLIVSGDVIGRSNYGSGAVGYVGLLATTGAAIAAPVPEPETYALLALGLAIVGWAVKQRNFDTGATQPTTA
jgi:hypothetical protein